MIRTPLARLGQAALAGVLAVGALAAPASAAAGRGTVQGTFTTDAGQPIAGASVYAYTADDQDYLGDTTTGDDGTYTLRNIRATDVKLQFHTRGLDQWAHRQADFASATSFPVVADRTLTVDERLHATGTLAGRLTDESGGPAAWVSVQAFTSEDWSSTYGYTDADGHYALDVLPGDYKVRYSRDATEQWAHGQTRREQATVFTVAAGQTVAVDDALLPTGTLGGRITDAGGAALPGAVVTLFRDEEWVVDATTDEDGRYTFQGVLPGEYRVGFAVDGGATQFIPGKLVRSQATVFTVTAGAHTVADDAQLAVGRMQGRLVDTAGEPVAGHFVRVAAGDEGSEIEYEAETASDGTWRVDGVFPGEYLVSFVKPDWTRRQYAYGKGTAAAADRVTLSSGATVTVDDTWVDGATLVVRATDAATGAPVADFCAYVSGADVSECTSGSEVTVRDLPEGSFEMSVTPGRKSFHLYSGDVDVTLTAGGTTTVTVPLAQGGKVSATITERAGGAPVRGACVDLAVLGRGGLGDGQGIACSNANGRLTTPALRPGTYEMFAYGPDGLGHQWVGAAGGTGDQRAAARITVKPGRVATAPTVLLDPAGTITGTVTGPAGAPLEGANVAYSAWGYGIGPSHDTDTDATGRWSLDVLGPYAWPLQFTYDGERIWSGGGGNRFTAETVAVTAGGTTTYDTVLDATAGLTGTATVAAGAGPWWRIEAVNAATGDPVGVADGEGTGPYTMALAGAQQVRLRWMAFGDGDFADGWHGGADQATAAKVRVPRSGAAAVDVPVGR
jgi:hypothetical protein